MKALLVVSFSLLGAEPKVVSVDKIQLRGKVDNQLAYPPSQDTPFTGKAVDYYSNGQKKKEANVKDGKLMSAEVWKPNGVKCTVTNVKEGNGVVVEYKEDGTEEYRFTYKDGERVRDTPPNP